jgi:hypothetical protein
MIHHVEENDPIRIHFHNQTPSKIDSGLVGTAHLLAPLAQSAKCCDRFLRGVTPFDQPPGLPIPFDFGIEFGQR